jgi:hypothetical protein
MVHVRTSYEDRECGWLPVGCGVLNNISFPPFLKCNFATRFTGVDFDTLEI